MNNIAEVGEAVLYTGRSFQFPRNESWYIVNSVHSCGRSYYTLKNGEGFTYPSNKFVRKVDIDEYYKNKYNLR